MKLRFTFLLVSLLFFIFTYKLFACSCIPLPSAQEEFLRTDFVFTGRVIHIESSVNLSRTQFEIIKLYKGEPAEINNNSVEVMSYVMGPSCGISFNINDEYLVFALYGSFSSNPEVKLTTSSCTRTTGILRATEIIKEIEDIKK